MAWQGPREFNGSLGEFRASFAGHGSFFVAVVVAAVAAHRLSQSSRWPSARSAELARGRRGVLSARRRSQLLQRRRYLGSTGDRRTATTTPPTAATTTMARLSLPLFSSSPLVVVARSFQVFFAAVGDIEAARSLEREREGDGDSVDMGRLSLSREREREQRPLSVPTSARRPTTTTSKAFLPPQSQWRPPIHALTLVTNSRNLMERGRGRSGGRRGAVSCGSRTASRWPPTSPMRLMCAIDRPTYPLSPLSLLVLCYYYLRRPSCPHARPPAVCLSVCALPPLPCSLPPKPLFVCRRLSPVLPSLLRRAAVRSVRQPPVGRRCKGAWRIIPKCGSPALPHGTKPKSGMRTRPKNSQDDSQARSYFRGIHFSQGGNDACDPN